MRVINRFLFFTILTRIIILESSGQFVTDSLKGKWKLDKMEFIQNSDFDEYYPFQRYYIDSTIEFQNDAEIRLNRFYFNRDDRREGKTTRIYDCKGNFQIQDNKLTTSNFDCPPKINPDNEMFFNHYSNYKGTIKINNDTLTISNKNGRYFFLRINNEQKVKKINKKISSKGNGLNLLGMWRPIKLETEFGTLTPARSYPLSFKKGASFNIYDGCNYIRTNYYLSGNNLSFSTSYTTTFLKCSEQERAFIFDYNSWIEIKDSLLVLTNKKCKIRFKRTE